MAEVKFAKGSEEWQMFMDYWALCQKYWESDNEDDYWNALAREANAFYKKYGTDFAKELALAIINEAERKWKEKSGKE